MESGESVRGLQSTSCHNELVPRSHGAKLTIVSRFPVAPDLIGFLPTDLKDNWSTKTPL